MAATRKIKGSKRSYYKAFKFLVEIDGIPEGGYQKCSEFESEIEEVAQRQGGAVVAQKDFGLVSFTDITLSRGASKDLTLYEWHKRCLAIAADGTDPGEEEKKTADILQRDRGENTLERIRLYEAWPSKYKLGGWDNEASENTQEEVTLKFTWGERIPV